MDAVVFDLGNVLIEWDPLRVVSERFVAEADFVAWNTELDLGAPWDDIVVRWCETHPVHADEVREFRDRWIETLGDIKQDTMAIVDELRAAGVRVFVLSNSSRDNAPRSPDVLRVFAHFDGVMLSSDVRVAKPDPAIYAATAEAFGLEPSRTWFVDDNAANVTGAAACGWHAIHYTTAASLRAELSAAGLIPTGGRSS